MTREAAERELGKRIRHENWIILFIFVLQGLQSRRQTRHTLNGGGDGGRAARERRLERRLQRGRRVGRGDGRQLERLPQCKDRAARPSASRLHTSAAPAALRQRNCARRLDGKRRRVLVERRRTSASRRRVDERGVYALTTLVYGDRRLCCRLNCAQYASSLDRLNNAAAGSACRVRRVWRRRFFVAERRDPIDCSRRRRFIAARVAAIVRLRVRRAICVRRLQLGLSTQLDGSCLGHVG